jgi:hypothetical protein
MSFHDAATPEDLPPSHQGEWEPDEPDPVVDREPRPDYDYVPFEQTRAYRDQLIDAGRGHLVRW